MSPSSQNSDSIIIPPENAMDVQKSRDTIISDWESSDTDIDEDDSYLEEDYWLKHEDTDDEKQQIPKKKPIRRPEEQLKSLEETVLTLSSPPRRMYNFEAARPIYYRLDDEEYILTFYHYPKSIHIARYSISENEWKAYTQLIMPSISICPNFVEPAYNALKQEIYFLYIDENEDKICGILNLRNTKWKLINKAIKLKGKHCSDLTNNTQKLVRSCFIPYPVGKEQIRTFNQDIQCEYFVRDKKLIWNQLNMEQALNSRSHPLVWMKWNKSMLVFGDHIFCCDLNKKNNDNNNYELRMLPIDSESENQMITVMGFQYILFIFTATFPEIFVYDTFVTGQLYQSDQFIPYDMSTDLTLECVVTKDNKLHFINCDTQKHYKLLLVDLIPHQLYQIYIHNLYQPLLNGYIINVYQNHSLYAPVPNDILYLILMFIPPFL